MIELIKNLFSTKSAEDRRVESFKKVAEKNGYRVRAIYKASNKMALEKAELLVVINLLENHVVTTIGNNKLKRFDLTDAEIKEVIIDPKVKIKNKMFKMI